MELLEAAELCGPPLQDAMRHDIKSTFGFVGALSRDPGYLPMFSLAHLFLSITSLSLTRGTA